MNAYTADELAVISTILARATASQTWTELGTDGSSTQEEVQMMRVENYVLIACNKNQHASVTAFLKAFGVNDETSFVNCLSWTHWLTEAQGPTAKNWTCNAGKKSTYSPQEKQTIKAYGLPAYIPALTTLTVDQCVGKQGATTPKDWKTGPFQQLLGWYSSNKTYKKGFANPPSAKVKTIGVFDNELAASFSLGVVTSSASVHAELKLLAVLAKVIIDHNLTNISVNLGGLKGACKKCAEWITNYQIWLTTKTITLNLPGVSERPSATPDEGAWNKPTVDTNVKMAVNGTCPNLFE